MEILIIGAGFSGAVHARECADAGHKVTVIDRRPHIAGNAYDHILNGVRVHKYGPHLFHTSNMRVVEWLSRFTEWAPYMHKVKAKLEDGRLVPFPVNRETVQIVTGSDLETLPQDKETASKASNARNYLVALIGEELTELFFQRYTEKMWGMSLKKMSSEVVRRVKIRTDDEDRYFPNDKFQALPTEGYTAIFEKILNHEKISVKINTKFNKSMEDNYDFIFNSMAIDEYFNYVFGRLPYRSIRFHTEVLEGDMSDGCVTINYTNKGPFTRETHWQNLPMHQVNLDSYVRTIEEPCSYEDNNFERYYPVKTYDNEFGKVYERYKEKASLIANRMKFIGRCGTYQYLDMDQVISQSLLSARKWLNNN